MNEIELKLVLSISSEVEINSQNTNEAITIKRINQSQIMNEISNSEQIFVDFSDSNANFSINVDGTLVKSKFNKNFKFFYP